MAATRDVFDGVGEVDERPAPPVSACLDAAVRCFQRNGLAGTTVPDVARELGVSRATVYRQVGTVRDLARLALRRELGRVLRDATPDLREPLGPDGVVALTADVVEGVMANRLLGPVLRDERATVAVGFLDALPGNVAVIAERFAPLLAEGMDRGTLARHDPDAVAEWVVRVAFTLVLAPAPQATRPFLAQVLVPLLAHG